jgi:hypothetical protein
MLSVFSVVPPPAISILPRRDHQVKGITVNQGMRFLSASRRLAAWRWSGL